MTGIARGAAVLLASVIGLTPAIGRAQNELSTLEMAALAPRVADRTVRHDLLSVLHPIQEISSGMLRRLRGVDLATVPAGTAFKGLCRQDVLSLLYAPTDLSPKREEQPLRPYGLEARTYFHAVRTPTGPADHADELAGVWTQDCERLDRDENTVWFSAHGPFQAAQAVNLLSAAVASIKSGKLTAISCSRRMKGTETCQALIEKEGVLDRINSIEACAVEGGQICYVIDLAHGTELKIVARGEHDALAPAEVQSLSQTDIIIVT
jgi:hypothetical protein